MVKRSVLLTLVVIFVIFCLVSCGEKNREYDEQEVTLAAKSLIESSAILNELYYGYGIAYDITATNPSSDGYCIADFLSVKSFGIETVDDIKEMTRQCFSQELSNLVIGTKLSSVSDGTGIVGYARYYQKYNALDNSPECIMVFKKADVLLTDKIVYDYNSVKALRSEGEHVIVSVNLTVTNKEGISQNQTLEVKLIEEASGWRLDSPTYARFISEKTTMN